MLMDLSLYLLLLPREKKESRINGRDHAEKTEWKKGTRNRKRKPQLLLSFQKSFLLSSLEWIYVLAWPSTDAPFRITPLRKAVSSFLLRDWEKNAQGFEFFSLKPNKVLLSLVTATLSINQSWCCCQKWRRRKNERKDWQRKILRLFKTLTSKFRVKKLFLVYF